MDRHLGERPGIAQKTLCSSRESPGSEVFGICLFSEQSGAQRAQKQLLLEPRRMTGPVRGLPSTALECEERSKRPASGA